MGLGFTSHELLNIEHTPFLIVDAPFSYLQTMLSNWYEWAPEDARGSTDYATLHSLQSALDGAGLNQVAQELGGFGKSADRSLFSGFILCAHIMLELFG